MIRNYKGTTPLASILLILLTGAGCVFGESYQWSGGNGDWSDSSKWTPPTGVPGAADQAFIGNGTVTVSADTSVGILQVTSASLAGEGTLTVTESLDWASGDWYGPGTTVVGPDATASLSGTEPKGLRGGRILVVEGDLAQPGSGELRFSDASLMDIREDGLVDLQSDATWRIFSGARSSIINAGTLHQKLRCGTQQTGEHHVSE